MKSTASKLLWSKIFWVRAFFRMLGLVCIGAGLYAFRSFSMELVELYKKLVMGFPDTINICVIFLSFFLGAPTLILIGVKLIVLRSFSYKMLIFAIFPITLWFLPIYNVDTLFAMDRVLTFGVLLFITYVLFFSLSLYVHTYWYMHQSHEKMGHIGTLEQNKTPNIALRIILILIIIFVLLGLHPTDFTTTLRMLLSPAQAFFDLFH